MTLNDLSLILFRASTAKYGLLVEVSNVDKALHRFAAAREESEARGESIAPLEFRAVSNPEGNLQIIRRGARTA